MKRQHRAVLAGLCAVFFSAGTSGAVNQHTEGFTTTTYKDGAGTTADWNTAAGELRLFPFVPSLLSTRITTGTAARDVVVDGALAFVAISDGGLQIIDVTDPTNPSYVGLYNTPGMALGVAVAGDLAFVADYSAGLQIIDISNAASPALVGTYDTPAYALGVAVSGDLAFVADYSAGLQIIDISNPASPALVGTYDTPAYAWGVAVAGDLVFVADHSAGLHILDIANPASPTLVATYDTPGYAYDVTVAGDLAFVADEASGLQIIDITNPSSPAPAGSYDTSGIARGVAVAGDLALVADDTSGLRVIRVGHVATMPALVGSYNTPWAANNIVVAGDLAFVADGISGLQILDITNPASPTLLGAFDTLGEALDVEVAGDLAFVADWVNGLQIVDISNPASPALVGGYDTLGDAYGVAVAGDLAFVAAYDSGLQVVDITNPASPTVVGTYDTPGYAWGVAVAGDLAFVGDWSLGLQIIDVSTPSSPTLVGTYDTPGYAWGVAVTGDLAFVADSNGGLQIIDISNPASPTLVGTYVTPPEILIGVDVAGAYAFLAYAERGLQILDITNPASPTLVGTYDTPGSARGVAVAGEIALVADYTAGVAAIQVFQHEVDPSGNAGRSIAVDGGDDSILRARLSTTQTAGVTWEVSADNGANWQAVAPDNAWNAFAVPGTDLRWRSLHTWAGTNPTVSDLQLEWLTDYAVIDAISDVPNDQGRQVRVEWTRSGHDFIGDPTQIVEYAIYREIDPGLGTATLPPPAPAFQHLSAAARENALLMQAAGWDFIATVPVRVEDSYAVVVPTLKDSTIAAGDYRSTFMVTALTATPGVFFDSPPDSGYSLDNLAPSVPASFAVAYNTGSGNTLSWDESPDADFQYFRVYRSSDPNFTPSPATMVHATTTPGWMDPEYDGGGVTYKVTATDFSGNESDAATAGSVTGVDGAPTPQTFALYPNVPNPFNPTTLIRYNVPERGGEVSLRVYDVSGRMVRTLVEGKQAGGERSVTWDGRDDGGRLVATGVYFYRMRAGSFVETRKMVLLK